MQITFDRLSADRESQLGDARNIAHTLKGTSANLGLTGLATAAAELEQVIDEGSDCGPALETLSRELAIAEFGAARLDLGGPDPKANHAHGDADPMPLVEDLDRQLADNNLEARRVFERLRSALSGRAPEATGRLAESIAALHFKDARHHLTDIASEIALRETLERR